MTLTHDERAARGAAVLERAKPGSVALLDVDTLDIALGSNCALGQIYGNYGDGLKVVFRNQSIEDGITSYGFNGINADDNAELTKSWKRLVLAAREPVRELVGAGA